MNVPEGYVPFGRGVGFIRHVGPIYFKKLADRTRTWIQLEERHVNGWGVAHGGFMMTMLDITLGSTAGIYVGRPGIYPTVQLGCNFVSAAAKIGDVLEGEAEVTRAAKRLCFITGRLFVGEETIVTASGIFRNPPEGVEMPEP